MTAVLVLDVETTGKDRARDQIIELCIQDDLSGGEQRGWRFKPSVPIHPEAQAVHGITAADLDGCPTFGEFADAITGTIGAADVIVGYNVAFDLDMIQSELVRWGRPPLDLSATHLVDAMRMWQHFEPRTLGAAHEKFLGLPMAVAHVASADVAATGLVLEAMIERFDLAEADWSEIAKVSDPLPQRHSWVGPTNHIQWENDRAVFSFGKNKGVPVDVADPGYLRWVQGQDFPKHVKAICSASTEMPHERFNVWLRERYPRRTPEATG